MSADPEWLSVINEYEDEVDRQLTLMPEERDLSAFDRFFAGTRVGGVRGYFEIDVGDAYVERFDKREIVWTNALEESDDSVVVEQCFRRDSLWYDPDEPELVTLNGAGVTEYRLVRQDNRWLIADFRAVREC